MVTHQGTGNGNTRTGLPELLAPAGSTAAFRAAVAAGADAVYLGGKRFGARRFAANFKDREIEDAVAYAHARGVAVYVTVNTLIHDRELAAVGEYLVWLYSIGADSVLVQDLGVATLAREVVPDLPLHASTQMTIHNADGVRAAAEMGFSRVVLARELTLSEIESIAKETAGTGTGLEVFAHGALCFSYSGQCLLSSVIGGRSGNRGMCAQPCRKPYTLVTGETDQYGRPGGIQEVPQDGLYLLSLKDLCTYPRLDRLVQSPVVSLKIEGRMKSPEYVAIVTAAYRRALDAIAQGGDFATAGEQDSLALSFNRGFTEGYLFGRRHSAVMGREQPDNRGLLLGTVEQYLPASREAVIRTASGTAPAPGDGLFITAPDPGRSGVGFSLNTLPVKEGDHIRFPVPRPVRPGWAVFLTSSTALAATARRIIAGDLPGFRNPVPVDCAVRVDGDGTVTLDGAIGAGNGRKVPVALRFDRALVPARTQPLTIERLKEQLQKTGGTPFAFRTLDLEYGGGLFAPAAEINRMRREFLARAEVALVATYLPAAKDVAGARERLAAALPAFPGPSGTRTGTVISSPELFVLTSSLQGVNAAIGAGCDRICFEPEGTCCSPKYSPEAAGDDLPGEVRDAAVLCRDAGLSLVWKLPRITHGSELALVRSLVTELGSAGLSACMAESIGAARVIRKTSPGLPVIGGSGLNVFNHRCALALSPLFSSLTLSPELSGTEIADLIRSARSSGCPVPFAVMVQGSTEAMVAENCLLEPVLRCSGAGRHPAPPGMFSGIRDSTGRIFPFRVDRSCRTHIFNADETCLIDHLPRLIRAGAGSLGIDARGKPPAYLREAVAAYRHAIRQVEQNKPSLEQDLLKLKGRLKEIAFMGITTGAFTRGLREA